MRYTAQTLMFFPDSQAQAALDLVAEQLGQDSGEDVVLSIPEGETAPRKDR